MTFPVDPGAPTVTSPPEPRIRRNMARCNHCKEVIESMYRHHFVRCECGKVFVDGGKDYLRRGFMKHGDFEELSEYEPT